MMLVVVSVWVDRPFETLGASVGRILFPHVLMPEDSTYRAKELWICLTNEKLLIASPRKAGVSPAVKLWNCRRCSPSSTFGILLTMFNKATLAQALSTVYVPSLARSKVSRALPDLIGKPYTIWAALFLLVRVFLSPFEKEYKAIYWPPVRPQSCLGRRWRRQAFTVETLATRRPERKPLGLLCLSHRILVALH